MIRYDHKVAFTMDLKSPADGARLHLMYDWLQSVQGDGPRLDDLLAGSTVLFPPFRHSELEGFKRYFLKACPNGELGLSTFELSARGLTVRGHRVAVTPLAELIRLCCIDSLPFGFEWANDLSEFIEGDVAGGACAIFRKQVQIKSTRSAVWELVNETDTGKWGHQLDYHSQPWPILD